MLRHNKITDSDVDILKNIMTDHPKLRTIYLDFNRLSDAFMVQLIKGNTPEFDNRLKSLKLHLTHNQLTEESFKQALGKVSNFSASSILAFNQIHSTLQDKYRKALTEEESISSPPLILSKMSEIHHKSVSDEKIIASEAKLSESEKPLFKKPF